MSNNFKSRSRFYIFPVHLIPDILIYPPPELKIRYHSLSHPFMFQNELHVCSLIPGLLSADMS